MFATEFQFWTPIVCVSMWMCVFKIIILHYDFYKYLINICVWHKKVAWKYGANSQRDQIDNVFFLTLKKPVWAGTLES